MTSLIADYLNTAQTSGVVELYQVDATPVSGGMLYLTNAETTSGTVIHNGLTYTSIPMAMSRPEMTTNGTLPQPQLSVAVTSNPLLRATIATLGDLAGCKVTRFSTLKKYLDAANFTRINKLDWSEDLSQSAWVKTAVTVTSNAVLAPNGTMTADLVLDTTANAQRLVSKAASASFIAGDLMYVSCYIKDAGIRYAMVYASASSTSGTGGGVLVDMTTGAILGKNNAAYVTNEKVTDVGDGWYRVSFNARAVGSVPTGRVYLTLTPSTGVPAYTGDGTKGVYVWGYQIELVDKATCDASTAFTGGSTIAQNTALVTSPDGLNTADIITDTTANSAHYAYWSVSNFLEGQKVTFTTHIRQGTFTKAQVRFFATTSTAYPAGGAVSIDLTNGSVIGSASNLDSYTIQALTNSWYRVAITITCVANGQLRPGVMMLNAAGSTTYTGTGTDTIYFWNGAMTWNNILHDYQMTTTSHQPYADASAISPVDVFYISQLIDFGPNTVTWKLVTPLDRPNLLVPRLQYLHDQVGNHIAAPGLSRVMD